jgi:hypothetical protein
VETSGTSPSSGRLTVRVAKSRVSSSLRMTGTGAPGFEPTRLPSLTVSQSVDASGFPWSSVGHVVTSTKRTRPASTRSGNAGKSSIVLGGSSGGSGSTQAGPAVTLSSVPWSTIHSQLPKTL